MLILLYTYLYIRYCFMACCCAPCFRRVVLHGWLSCSRLRVWCFMAGCRASWLAVVLPGGWWCLHGGWWCILASSAAYCSQAPRQGHAPTPQCGGARRRNPSFKGIKMKGYCSIYQLFKLSSWVALYKSFMD